MKECSRFLTIREVAKTGLLPEHYLRMMERQWRLPGIYAGRKKLINVPQLVKMLDAESEAAVSEACGGE